MAFAETYRGKRVLVTGHTGFKGAWLCEWLVMLGANVTGFALAPPTTPSLYDQLGLDARLRDIRGDIRDLGAVRRAFSEAKPDVVFHLAAQSLVRRSYDEPVETYSINIMGTVNVLEAARLEDRSCAVVAITTDKCYDNKEWVHSYREEDPLGGYDPYSSSKGAAELVIAAYRRSFFSKPQGKIHIASARAGNVIGGGDWASDRIVPDCIRALQRGESIQVRNPASTRPWQHVIEPLSGYLWLGAKLLNAATPGDQRSNAASAFNFGPALNSNRPVIQLVEEVLKHWPGRWEDKSNPAALHEAMLLNLAVDKAYHFLGWSPVWNFEQTISQTVTWYRRNAEKYPAGDNTRAQISEYAANAAQQNLPWSK